MQRKKNFYDNNVFYNDINSDVLFKDRVQDILKTCSYPIRGKILDAGAGSGKLSKYLKEYDSRFALYGADISDYAKDSIFFDDFKSADFSIEIPYQSDYFDVVISHQVVEHLVDPDRYLEEINRVLKKGGVLILTTPNLLNWLNRILVLFGVLPISYELSYRHRVGHGFINKILPLAKPVGHVRVFNKSGLRELVKIHNFNIEGTHGMPMYQYSNNFLLKNIDKLANNIATLSSNLMIVATKK